MQSRSVRAARRSAAPPPAYDVPVDATVVTPRPAATVVLLRPGTAGLEVLLTHRPSSMAFAPDMHVFPGGRVDESDADPRLIARSALTPQDAAEALGGDLSPTEAIATYIAAIREAFEEAGVLLADGADHRALEVARAELLHVVGSFPPMVEALDLRLRTDLLVPLSRWVTPPGLPRRFDARFFAAALPDRAEATLVGDEVAAHAWHTPRAALDEMASGRLGMWLPTSATLQQLEHAQSIDEVRDRLTPRPSGPIGVEEVDTGIARIEMPSGGGVAGQPVNAYLVGTSSMILVDPGDPTGPALERALEAAAERGGTVIAVALTSPDPGHAGGAEAIREAIDVPVYVGPGGGHDLPYRVTEIADGAVIEAGPMALRVVGTPGPGPDHLAFIVEDAAGVAVAVLAGDLDGVRGARSLPGPADDAAWAGSVARLRSAAPDVPWLGGHPPVTR
jgi:glyoxylase-like metal-dependent hydrolase (beta-lactamase superfamily II)/8-oxo-dGTP pyrophosphatase MutT (NUDIX family)